MVAPLLDCNSGSESRGLGEVGTKSGSSIPLPHLLIIPLCLYSLLIYSYLMCQLGLILSFLYAGISFNPHPLRLPLLPLKSKKGACLHVDSVLCSSLLLTCKGTRKMCSMVATSWSGMSFSLFNHSWLPLKSKKIASFHVDDVLSSSPALARGKMCSTRYGGNQLVRHVPMVLSCSPLEKTTTVSADYQD